MSLHAHRAAGSAPVTCAILTISDTRTTATDTGGALIASLLEEAGHVVAARQLVRDEPAPIVATVMGFCERDDVMAVITTGGTGMSPRDQTVDALVPAFDRSFDGFGELFRMLSFQEIGAAAMLSRATAGIIRQRPVFVLPGSPAAITLAVTRLILPELGHLVHELRKVRS